MQRSTDADDARRRFDANSTPVRTGDALDLSPVLYLKNDTSLLPPIPPETGGLLGRNIILAGERSNLGSMPIRSLPLATRQAFLARRANQALPAWQRPTGNQQPMPATPAQPSNISAAQPQRSFFDLSGRLHDFQAGPKIARPNLAEEFIPVVGPAWDAAADLQDGHYGSAAFNAAMAVGDLLPVGYGIKAGRGALKLVREMGTFAPKAAAIQRKMHKIGLALPTEDVHHVFELNGLGRYVPNWKNNPLFLKVLLRETHRRLHTSWGGKPKFGLIPRLWHGTTDWMKATAAGLGSYIAESGENLEGLFSAPSQTPGPSAERPD